MLIWTTSGMMEHDHNADGRLYLNCYSQASTQLGRDLSNFASLGFNIPGVGRFASMEGYWHWIATGKKYPEFMSMNGYKAKMASRSYKKVHNPNFEQDICAGVEAKLTQNPTLLQALIANKLPLAHFRFNHQQLMDIPPDQMFWLEAIDNVRRCYDF